MGKFDRLVRWFRRTVRVDRILCRQKDGMLLHRHYRVNGGATWSELATDVKSSAVRHNVAFGDFVVSLESTRKRLKPIKISLHSNTPQNPQADYFLNEIK